MSTNTSSPASGSPTITVAAVGAWHVHTKDYAKSALEHPGTSLVALWDDDLERGSDVAATFGVEFVTDLDALLARDDLDAVFVTAATIDHTDVIGRALRAGKHVFTEKLLAPTTEDCRDLAALAEERNLALVVSLPRMFQQVPMAVFDLVDSGTLGTINYARVRLGHDGWVGNWLVDRFGDPVAAIGGALTDLGCHPVYLVRRILGTEPATIDAVYTYATGHAVEDNAVVTMAYADGAIGVAESSFITVPGEFSIEVVGDRGSVHHGAGIRGLIGKGEAFGADWVDVPLPDPVPGPFARWVSEIQAHRAGEQVGTDLTVAAAIDLTAIVSAANAAAAR